VAISNGFSPTFCIHLSQNSCSLPTGINIHDHDRNIDFATFDLSVKFHSRKISQHTTLFAFYLFELIAPIFASNQAGSSMNDMLIATFGLICGFFSSSPPGTINLWLINQTLNQRKESIWFLLGVVTADCIYASLAVWGYHSLIDGTPIETAMLVAGAACIIIMGAITLLSKSKEPNVDLTMSEKPIQQLAMGLLMCGSNPAFLLFWIFAVGILEEQFSIKIEGLSLLFFNLGIVVGDYIWFTLQISIVRTFRRKITSKYLSIINRIIGITFLVIGSLAIIKLL